MKPVFKLGLSAVMVTMLVACSGADSRRQASSNFKYLEAAPLSDWKSLPDQQPDFSNAYHIPAKDFQGPVGRDIDIRPPQQILELIPGARYERSAEGITVWVPREEQTARLWQTIDDMVAQSHIPVRTSSPEGIETDWLRWAIDEDEEVIESRYVVKPVQARGRSGFHIEMVEWKRNGSSDNLTQASRDRYNAQMINMITSRYDEDLREEARLRALELVKNIPISLGKDRGGSPVIIARASYDVFWERFPEMLNELGFTVEERNRSQGTLSVNFTSPDDEFWEETGVLPLQLDQKKYNILLGDLGNRTSINVTDNTGKPVEEDVLAGMVPAFTAAIERLNNE